MARIDYFGLEDEIGKIFRADSTLEGVKVTVEDDVEFEVGPLITIYIDRRDPTDGQSLSAGTRTRYLLRIIIWCWQYSLESLSNAIRLRDDLLGKVELVLMKNRTVSGKVQSLWLGGGELPSARIEDDAPGYIAGGEIIVTMEVSATT